MWNKFISTVQEPKFLRQFHGYTTLLWIVLMLPALLWWSESVPFLVIISVWANIAGHWAAWQASRVEVKEDNK